jgi:hypothetical protein
MPQSTSSLSRRTGLEQLPADVTLRIRRVSQLRNLCLRLAKAGAEARKKEKANEERPADRN